MIELLHTPSQSTVEAIIVPLDRITAKRKIDGQWWAIPVSRTLRHQESDHSWSWAKIVGESRQDRFSEVVGLATGENEIQGAMCYNLGGKSLLENGLGSVFVHYLATAPRNRPWLVDQPEFRGIGLALLRFAAAESWRHGLCGRLTLASYPCPRTTEFYENRGFVLVEEDEDGMIAYELPPVISQAWREEERWTS